MQNTFCLGFTGVKHSWGILLKSPWNQCYLTSSKSCASFVFSQAFSRGMVSQQDWAEILGTSPKRREDGRMFGNMFGGVWSVAVTWSQRQDALGKGKDGPFTKHIWLKKKADAKLDLFGLRNELGSSQEFPWKTPTYLWARGQRKPEISQYLTLSVLFPTPSPHGCFRLFLLLRSELALRLDADQFRWQLKGCLSVLFVVLDRQVQQAQADGKSLTGPTGSQKFPMTSFPPPDFLLVVPFLLPPAKIGLHPSMSESFPRKLFGSRLGIHLGVMLLDWKKCATHIIHMLSVDLNPDLYFPSAPLGVVTPQVLAPRWHCHKWSTTDTK